MKKLRHTMIRFVLTILVGASIATASHPKQKVWDFEENSFEELSRVFYFDETGDASKATWRLIKEGGNQILHQSANISGSTPYALAVVDKSKFQDVSLTVRVKAGAAAGQPKAGVVWRYRNSENYLVACLDFQDDRIRLYRVVRGNRVMFGAGEEIILKPGIWYTLRVEHRGDRIKVYLDNEAFIIEKDKHYRESGKVGLWTQTDAATSFDDLRVAHLAKRK